MKEYTIGELVNMAITSDAGHINVEHKESADDCERIAVIAETISRGRIAVRYTSDMMKFIDTERS